MVTSETNTLPVTMAQTSIPKTSTNARDDTLPRASFRGPLKYEIETSSPSLEAGSYFSIFLRITNPYDVPVQILDVTFPVPAEFVEPEFLFREPGSLRRMFGRMFGPNGQTQLPGLGGYRMAEGVTVSRMSQVGNLGSSQQAAESTRKQDAIVEIQPGNTMCKEVKFRTIKSILFTPAVYNLEAQVRYSMDGKTNHDAVKVPLNIKAPLTALIAGAVPGAIVGNLLRGSTLTLLDDPKTWTVLFSSVLLSIIVIVAFARKKDAQPFLSVEDFYGGLFVGFLVGYSGESWLKTLIGSTNSSSPGH